MNYLFLHTKHSYISVKQISASYQSILRFGSFTTLRRSSKAKQKGLDKALKILDFVNPETCKAKRDDRHQRLIQSCMHDLLEVPKRESADTKFTKPKNFLQDDFFLLIHELHKRGISPDAHTLSSIISSYGTKGSFDSVLQLHAFSIKIGVDESVSVGTSLISLYSKCGKLNDAFNVFQEIPEKNTASWTSIIAGYAQNWRLETCLYLFNLMRQSDFKPNDFTYASLLSVCTNCASLSLGRSFHCSVIRLSYDSCTHVSNALISMYAKCGVIEEARYLFDKLPSKDLISWNSMIFGYAHYGIADQALILLKEMDKNKILPDTITFLGVLSSCRHAGLVDKGHDCFNLMLKHGITPELDHYSCIVDLLGRAGLLEEAMAFIEKMPITPNSVIWGSILSSCRVHGNVWIGIYAAKKRLSLEPGCAATHVQLANLYASIKRWNDVAKVRKLMKDRGIKTVPGYSWIEIGNKVYRFKAEDGTNSEIREMVIVLDTLADHMQCFEKYV